MKNILIHGLGQNNRSWNICKDVLVKNGLESEAPNLYSMMKDEKMEYNVLFQKFTD